MKNSQKLYAINDYAETLIHHKARQLVGEAGYTEDDVEELEQEMRLDLLKRLPKFNPKIATYNTFVSRLVERKICNLIRHRTRKVRDYRREEGSLDDTVETDSNSVEKAKRIETISQDEYDFRSGRYCRSAAERLDLQLDVSLVLSKLPPKLQKLAELLKTMSITEAARELGIPRSTLYSSGLARLREAFNYTDPRKIYEQYPTFFPCAG